MTVKKKAMVATRSASVLATSCTRMMEKKESWPAHRCTSNLLDTFQVMMVKLLWQANMRNLKKRRKPKRNLKKVARKAALKVHKKVVKDLRNL